MNLKTPGQSRTATVVSLSLFLAALIATMLPAWSPEIMFSLLGGGADSGHAAAWAGAVSFYLYLALTFGVMLAALGAATVMAVRSRNWRWFLAGEVLVFGLSFWVSTREVLKEGL